ncbi:Uncharacterized membrane-anchored protein YitT, contains DUF161 and DUF2179 domains [Seinonella peptonophila]|uniref:Uncharacterized membrane-anchored protein YitT, contains DUF161 and DUF2179 domains n=1 Tax=Seinonella peptonophila TaxID=112248 RepID=A0A1M4SV47_9BACL|nr:YitT family protein [Seinonella peptonophila]SHE35847.1 Uncharacterized membrane-anchored protein YitT, contains DUF161 and DUF2179 domains [Seinonella peptonophila]
MERKQIMKKSWFTHLKSLILIILGSFLFSIGVNSFAIANHLAEGGFAGISILLHYLYGWSPGTIMFIINIPLFIIGYKILGKQTFIYSLVGLGSVTLFLNITANWKYPMDDLLLAALFTGIFVGLGLGIVIRTGGTTGGVDIIARILHKYFGISIGQIMFLFDLCVLLVSIFVIGLTTTMYTLITVFVGAKIIDFVIEGLNRSKAVTIISERASNISTEITKRMGRGVTIMHGRGAYTGNAKEILYIVIAAYELPKLKELVLINDPHAFIVVHDARDVLGEGFTYEKEIAHSDI